MNILDFEIGDKVKIVKKFNNHSPHESWETTFGCPPLDPGTTGIVKKVNHDHVVFEVINPISKKTVNILAYTNDASDTEDSEKIDCFEIVEKFATAA